MSPVTFSIHACHREVSIIFEIHAKSIRNVLDPTTQTLDWNGGSFSSSNASATYDSPPQSASHMSRQIFHTCFPLKHFEVD